MRFLPKELDGISLTPVDFKYMISEEGVDSLFCIVRENQSRIKHVVRLDHPKFRYYVVKPEFRGTSHAPADRFRDFIEIEYLEEVTCEYADRYNDARKKIKGLSFDEVKKCPFILGLDVDIKTFYYMEFKKEYGNDEPKVPYICFADIETDARDLPYVGIAPPGTAEINAITLIDSVTRKSYTWCLHKDAYKGIDTMETPEGMKAFVKDLNDSFDPVYGEIEYQVNIFNDEKNLMAAFWQKVNEIRPDFLEFWNMPFDMSNLLKRPEAIGIDTMENIMDKEYFEGYREYKFEEDKNHLTHKRKHKCELPNSTIIIDQMVAYAVIRAAGSKIPTFKLNAIADKELGDKKVEYADLYGSILDFPYENFPLFIKYNIKDVLLQFGIETKTKDTTDIFGRMYDFCVDASSINTTTSIVANHYREELEAVGKIMHCNRNKLDLGANVINLGVVKNNDAGEDEIVEASAADIDEFYDILSDIADSESIVDEDGKKKKFSGAIVLTPTRMNPTGFDGFKYIHNNVADGDITSEYPSGIQITNLSNETFLGKVLMDDENAFDLPMYNGYYFANSKEESQYKPNKAAILLETFLQGDILIGMELGFGMPSPSKVLESLDMSTILKKKVDDK